MRRDPISPLSATPTRLDSYPAAVALALMLAADFDHAHVVALTDTDHTVIDGVILHEPAHGIDHAVGFGLCLARLHEPVSASGAIFYSIGTNGADQTRPVDAVTWRRMREIFAGLPVVRDWFITDGVAVRSMALTTSDHNDVW